jgi:hypothetical protein
MAHPDFYYLCIFHILYIYLFSSPAVKPARFFLFPMQGANKKLRDTHVQRSKITHDRIIRISHMKTV